MEAHWRETHAAACRSSLFAVPNEAAERNDYE
jgi:hypothetical protein